MARPARTARAAACGSRFSARTSHPRSRNARAVTALVWRAGLHMRTAVAIQSGLLKLSDILPARGWVPLQPVEE